MTIIFWEHSYIEASGLAYGEAIKLMTSKAQDMATMVKAIALYSVALATKTEIGN
jgi:hypothetical protein